MEEMAAALIREVRATAGRPLPARRLFVRRAPGLGGPAAPGGGTRGGFCHARCERARSGEQRRRPGRTTPCAYPRKIRAWRWCSTPGSRWAICAICPDPPCMIALSGNGAAPDSRPASGSPWTPTNTCSSGFYLPPSAFGPASAHDPRAHRARNLRNGSACSNRPTGTTSCAPASARDRVARRRRSLARGRADETLGWKHCPARRGRARGSRQPHGHAPRALRARPGPAPQQCSRMPCAGTADCAFGHRLQSPRSACTRTRNSGTTSARTTGGAWPQHIARRGVRQWQVFRP